MNEKACIISLSTVANQQIVNEYEKKLKEAKKYEDKIQIIRQINEIIRSDYKKQITNIEEFDPNKPFRFICHTINNITVEDPTKGYHGTIISCSMLSNEQNGTYKSNYGFVYNPENIITAREGDASINNFSEDIENSSAINTIPMVQSVTELIEKTRDYNEVAIKKAEPIAIFCKADSKEDQSYKNALSLQQKFSHLKIIMLQKVPIIFIIGMKYFHMIKEEKYL